MHGLERGKSWRLYQKLTYRYKIKLNGGNHKIAAVFAFLALLATFKILFGRLIVAHFLGYEHLFKEAVQIGAGHPPGLDRCGAVTGKKQPILFRKRVHRLLGAGQEIVADGEILLVGLGAAGFAGLIIIKGGYWMRRVLNFTDPFEDALGSGYQVSQGLLAFGSGGVFGVGLGKSMQKALYLPEAMSDFILPIIGEELGFVGVMALMAVYLFLIWRGCLVSINAKDLFGTLLAGGITLHIALQVILNIAVVTASFPPTGVVLPLISLGGTATVLFMAELGMLYNISKQAEERDV